MDGLDKFLEPANWQLAWEHVAENHGAAGVDGETIEHFASNADRYLAQLRRAVKSGTYQPLPLRQVFIPKRDGTWRSIGIPTVRDRIVQQALLNILHPILEPEFEDCSFAYRPGRSHQMAVRQVATWRDRGYEWVFDADLIGYFDNIQHDRLLQEVRRHIDLSIYLDLVEGWLAAGVLTKEGLILQQRGVAQGAVVSPILANLYLDSFDEAMLATGLKLVRYADDFVLLNPYLGNLHGSDRASAFLAFDLMEEFRSPIVDTLVMRLINQKILRPTDFTFPDPEGGIYLEPTPRRLFLKHFETRISTAIKYPTLAEPISYRRVIQLQIQQYIQALLTGVDYVPFRRVD